MHSGASGCVARRSPGASKLSRGFGSSPRSSPAARSRPAVRYILDLSSVEPVPPSEVCSTASSTPEYSSTVFQVQRRGSRGSNPPLYSLSSRRRRYALNPSRFGLVCPSVYLTEPSLAGTPHSGASDGSSPVCLHRDPH